MIFRTAVARDAPAISQLLLAVARKQLVLELGAEARALLLDSFSLAQLRKYLLARVTERSSGSNATRSLLRYRYWMASEGEELLGVLGMREECHLFHLFVKHSVQGKGLGRQLWGTYLAERHSRPETVTVNSSPNAVGFYERLGFERSGTVQWLADIPSVPLKWCDPKI